MKKAAWLVAAFMTLLITACSGGSYAIGVGQLDSTSNSISGQYTSFSGHYYRETKFTAGERVKFEFLIHTKEGSIKAYLIDPSGTTIAALTNGETVQIPKTGSYKIQVESAHHGGHFYLTWNKMGQ